MCEEVWLTGGKGVTREGGGDWKFPPLKIFHLSGYGTNTNHVLDSFVCNKNHFILRGNIFFSRFVHPQKILCMPFKLVVGAFYKGSATFTANNC